MKLIKLMFKNAFRHKLRSFLTIAGIAIAVIAFDILRTVVNAWDAGIEATAANRLITRQAVSFIFPLPYSYRDRIKNIEGVEQVTFATWFGGVYKDKSNFFGRLAVEAETAFDIYSEYVVPPDQLEAFKRERNSCVVGSDLVKLYGFKLGDIVRLEGDIYPGTWDFVVKGIYTPNIKNGDATQMFFHWEYVDERMKKESPFRAGEVGWYIVRIAEPNRSGDISAKIDDLFKNSSAETKTESERAFAQGFMSSVSSILTAMNVLSWVIIGIIMLVLANTMIMASRERTKEYAVMKVLGFAGKHLSWLIIGESMVIAFTGGVVGILLSFPIVQGIGEAIPKNIFPVFNLEYHILVYAFVAALLVGLISSVFPIIKALRTPIVEGFRHIG
ncbi:MAG: FtsX-like permease family protein [Ignavibacteriaceae bacterium]|nr:FtsX-like permease family protein [Ignavibacteriaceae bacterium]